jgi:hypothetical protein
MGQSALGHAKLFEPVHYLLQCNADLLKVLIRQVAQYSEIDVVLGKALGVAAL